MVSLALRAAQARQRAIERHFIDKVSTDTLFGKLDSTLNHCRLGNKWMTTGSLELPASAVTQLPVLTADEQVNSSKREIHFVRNQRL